MLCVLPVWLDLLGAAFDALVLKTRRGGRAGSGEHRLARSRSRLAAAVSWPERDADVTSGIW